MAHRIEMKAPSTELGKTDVVFSVHIDGKKRGDLGISQGGVTWWPRNSRGQVHEADWSMLADWLESL